MAGSSQPEAATFDAWMRRPLDMRPAAFDTSCQYALCGEAQPARSLPQRPQTAQQPASAADTREGWLRPFSASRIIRLRDSQATESASPLQTRRRDQSPPAGGAKARHLRKGSQPPRQSEHSPQRCVSPRPWTGHALRMHGGANLTQCTVRGRSPSPQTVLTVRDIGISCVRPLSAAGVPLKRARPVSAGRRVGDASAHCVPRQDAGKWHGYQLMSC